MKNHRHDAVDSSVVVDQIAVGRGATDASSVTRAEPTAPRNLRLLALLAGGFFVVLASIVLSAFPPSPSLVAHLPDAPLIMVLDHDALELVARRPPSFFETDALSLVATMTDGPAAIVFFDNPTTVGLVFMATSEERTRWGAASSHAPLISLGRGLVAIPRDRAFIERVRGSRRIPWWNQTELAAALSHGSGFVRVGAAPSDIGEIKMAQALEIRLPRSSTPLPLIEAGALDALRIELDRVRAALLEPSEAPLRLPDGVVARELRIPEALPALVSGELPICIVSPEDHFCF